MITIEELDRYHCDTLSCEMKISKPQLRPWLLLHYGPTLEEAFYIVDMKQRGNGYVISMNRPEYICDSGEKLCREDKEILVKALNNGGWKAMLDALNENCNDCDLMIHCKHRFRNLSQIPPDYMQLPE